MIIRKLLSGILTIIAISLFISCEDDTTEVTDNGYGILPEQFKVDIPSSISNTGFKSANFKSTEEDTLMGNEIYAHLNFFIAVGESAADMVEEIMYAIKFYKIENVSDLTYLSDEDSRTKHLVVTTDVEFNGQSYEYMLTITDQLSESNEDGGIGMQVFWNNDPIEGIALLKPYNINRIENADAANAAFSIEYSAKGDELYDEFMIVEIAGLPLPDATTEPYGLETMKMFVGKKGNIVSVRGNSNHPNAQFNYSNNEVVGFNWAFVAAGHDTKDISVAELGLPASNANISTRQEILVDNSMKVILTREITKTIIAENPELEGMEALVAAAIAPYLTNTDAPGFFDKNGFIQAADSPGLDYDELEDQIMNLTPFNPSVVSNLTIEFKR